MASRDKPRVPDVLAIPQRHRARGRASVRCGSAPSSVRTRPRSSAAAALPETPVRGPLIIGEFDTTIVVPPDFQVMRDPFFNVVLTRIGAAGGRPTESIGAVAATV